MYDGAAAICISQQPYIISCRRAAQRIVLLYQIQEGQHCLLLRPML